MKSESHKWYTAWTVVEFTNVTLEFVSVTWTVYSKMGIPSRESGRHHVKSGQLPSGIKYNAGTSSKPVCYN